MLLVILVVISCASAQTSITSTPPTFSPKIGQLWTYSVTTSPGNAALSLSTAPSGASLSGNQITWTPTVQQAGANSFTVAAGSATQTFSVNVDPAVFRFRCGTTTNFTDHNGFFWLSDNNVAPSGKFGFTVSNLIGNTVDDSIFQLETWVQTGNLFYNIPVPNGNYSVDLGWSENWSGAQVNGGRVFGVIVQGTNFFPNFDIFANAGAFNAIIKTVNVTVTNGVLNLNITRNVQNPKINNFAARPIPPPSNGVQTLSITTVPPSALAVFSTNWQYQAAATGNSPFTWQLIGAPSGASVSSSGLVSFTPTQSQAGQTFTFRLNVRDSSSQSVNQTVSVTVDPALMRFDCGGPTFTDASGFTWLPDTNVVGAGAQTFISPTNGITEPFITHSWLAGPLSYHIPIANGNYFVTLWFCEIWTGITGAGQRTFTVAVENSQPVQIDAFQMAGFGVPLAINFSIAVQDSSVDIAFVQQVQNPFIAAISIFPGSASQNNFVCNTSAGFIQQANGNCVFPTTANFCPNNQYDCAVGCAASNPNRFNNLCRGGQCINGTCVKTTVTQNFLTSTVDPIIVNFCATGKNTNDTTFGAIVRGAFHAISSGAASACFLVTQCGGQACEFTATHNLGLQALVTSVHTLYDSNNLAPFITITDFFYRMTTVTVNISSNGGIIIPYHWNHAECQCVNILPPSGQPACSNLPSFPNAMPDPAMNFANLTIIMENQFGFNRSQWLCLLGAHALGKCSPEFSGYARNWSPTAQVLDNGYFQTLANTNLIWVLEKCTGCTAANPFTDEFQPVFGNTQYSVQGNAAHRGQMMLHADITSFWDCDTNPNLNVTHDGSGCPQRNDASFAEFNFLSTLAGSLSAFQSCFGNAFQKMIELKQTSLLSPS